MSILPRTQVFWQSNLIDGDQESKLLQVQRLQVKCRDRKREKLPRPLVNSDPIWTLFIAMEFSKACASVFTAQNSTPCRQDLHL